MNFGVTARHGRESNTQRVRKWSSLARESERRRVKMSNAWGNTTEQLHSFGSRDLNINMHPKRGEDPPRTFPVERRVGNKVPNFTW